MKTNYRNKSRNNNNRRKKTKRRTTNKRRNNKTLKSKILEGPVAGCCFF